MLKQAILLFILLSASLTSRAYRLEEGQYYVGGGFGANVNVVRFDTAPRATPRAQLPILANLDYTIDKNFGVFGSFIQHFGAGNVALGFRAGAKYWFSFLDAPYVPYVSFALVPSFLFPMGEAPVHFNLGFSPGAGMNFFVMSKFMVGAHVHFNPSVAFADGAKRFEFSVMTYFDVTLKI